MTEVEHKDAHDLAETQGHDGQVVTPQLEHRRAQHQTGHAGNDTGNDHDDPEIHVQAVGEHLGHKDKGVGEMWRCQQAVQVSAHRKEGDVTEV